MTSSGPMLIVGLGNPGPGYANHRHNVGAMVLEELASRSGAALRRHKAAQALVAEVRLGAGSGGLPGPRAVLARPTTFMNDSGGPVAGLCGFFSLRPDDVVAIHDDLEVPFGDVRVKRGGGEGGHNGLRSISRSLKTRDYLRVRVGIGRPPGREDPGDFVLKPFTTTQRRNVPLLVSDAADVIDDLCCGSDRFAP